MSALATAPGVIKAPKTTYVTSSDVMKLLGCKNNKAYAVIRDVNKFAAEKGQFSYGSGKANKYLFAEKFGIPIDVVDTIIEENNA